MMKFLEWNGKLAIDELASKAPTLLHVLTTIASRSDHCNSKKLGSAHYPDIIMSAAVILKERNREMIGIQSLISLLLFNSRVEKQVNIIIHFVYIFMQAILHNQVYHGLNHVGICPLQWHILQSLW